MHAIAFPWVYSRSVSWIFAPADEAQHQHHGSHNEEQKEQNLGGIRRLGRQAADTHQGGGDRYHEEDGGIVQNFHSISLWPVTRSTRDRWPIRQMSACISSAARVPYPL